MIKAVVEKYLSTGDHFSYGMGTQVWLYCARFSINLTPRIRYFIVKTQDIFAEYLFFRYNNYSSDFVNFTYLSPQRLRQYRKIQLFLFSFTQIQT